MENTQQQPAFTQEQMQSMMQAMQNQKPQQVIVKNNMSIITKIFLYGVATILLMVVMGKAGASGGAIAFALLAQQIWTIWMLWNA